MDEFASSYFKWKSTFWSIRERFVFHFCSGAFQKRNQGWILTSLPKSPIKSQAASWNPERTEWADEIVSQWCDPSQTHTLQLIVKMKGWNLNGAGKPPYILPNLTWKGWPRLKVLINLKRTICLSCRSQFQLKGVLFIHRLHCNKNFHIRLV